jgi:hypothetical protein
MGEFSSHRRKSDACPKFDMGLNLSPILLPVFATRRGRGSEEPLFSILKKKTPRRRITVTSSLNPRITWAAKYRVVWRGKGEEDPPSPCPFRFWIDI